MSKYYQEQLKLFHRFYSTSEQSKYTMKFLGDVPHFYTQKCDDNGVRQTRKVTNGRRCNSCCDFLLSSAVKPLRNIFMKRSALFQKMLQIQYKPTLVESDHSSIFSFIKSLRRSISSSIMELLHNIKYHIDLHIKLKGRFPKYNLYPSGYTIVQVTGADAFLNIFFDLYTKNPALK